jgi:transposase
MGQIVDSPQRKARVYTTPEMVNTFMWVYSRNYKIESIAELLDVSRTRILTMIKEYRETGKV